MNKVELIGFAGSEAEIMHTSSTNKLAKFSLATSESYKKGDEWVKTTQWHKIIAWGPIADKALTIVKKGARIRVEGKIQYGVRETQEGVKVQTTEIKAMSIEEVRTDGAETINA